MTSELEHIHGKRDIISINGKETPLTSELPFADYLKELTPPTQITVYSRVPAQIAFQHSSRGLADRIATDGVYEAVVPKRRDSHVEILKLTGKPTYVAWDTQTGDTLLHEVATPLPVKDLRSIVEETGLHRLTLTASRKAVILRPRSPGKYK